MATINFGGLASGIDTASLIDKLVSVERQPITQLQQQKSNANSRLSILGTLVSRLQALGEAARGVDTSTELTTLAAASSDETRVKASVSSAASPGTYDVVVTALARAQLTLSQSYGSDAAGVAGTGSVDITVGGKTTTVQWDGADSLSDIAACINGSGARVTASVLFDGSKYRLTVAGSDSGAAAAVTFAEQGDALGLSAQGATVVTAQDAAATINSIAVTRPTNDFSGVVTGLSLRLGSLTPQGGAPTTVTVTNDVDGLRKKAQSLVDAYNAVVQTVNGQLAYNGTTKGDNTLFGDSTVRGLQQRLGGIVGSTYAWSGGTTSVGRLGIVLARDGTLSIDAAKFNAAVAADPLAAEHLLAGTGGLAAALTQAVTDYTASGTGALVVKQAGITRQNQNIDEQIQRVEDAATSLGDRLRAQFTQMEQVIAGLKSQSTYLMSLFGASQSG